jgi:putative transcriptional regulator
MNAPRVKLVTGRKKLDLTQDEVARRVGISRAYLANIEAGKHTPSLEVAAKLSAVLKMSIDDLFL